MKQIIQVYKCRHCNGSEYGIPKEIPESLTEWLGNGETANIVTPSNSIIHKCFKDRIEEATAPAFFGICDPVAWKEVKEKEVKEKEVKEKEEEPDGSK